MKIFANYTVIFVPIAVPCVWRKVSPLNWNEFSFRIKPNISFRKRVGIGGLLLWNVSYPLHTTSIPFSCGMFVFKLVTSLETKIVSWPILVFSINLMKSVVSFI